MHAVTELEVTDGKVRLPDVILKRIELRLIDAVVLSELGVETLEGIEILSLIRLIERLAEIEVMEASAARLLAGMGEFGRYFPLSTPCASGDQTTCEIPALADKASKPFSGSRCNREYCGWLETKRTTFLSCSAASIRSSGHSEKPI